MSSGAPALSFAISGAKQKPVLDEGSFQQLLAAAYVIQQHHESTLARNNQLDTARALSEVSEMQLLARAGKLELPLAAKLITEQLLKMAEASGVSLSLIRDGYLDCVAESGVPVKLPGSSLASHSLVATERLKSGEIFDCRDAQNDIRLDTDLCQGLSIGSLIAAPVLRFGELAGLMEVRWARPRAFDETGLLVCRLMASLVTELLQRQGAPAKKMAVVAEASTPAVSPREAAVAPEGESRVIQTAESSVSSAAANRDDLSSTEGKSADAKSVEPAHTQSTRLEDDRLSEQPVLASAVPASAPAIDERKDRASSDETQEGTKKDDATRCRVCGRPLRQDEAFCGFCSMPRVEANPSRELQSKWASLWFMQQAHETVGAKKQEEEKDPDSSAPAIAPAATRIDSPTGAEAASTALASLGAAETSVPEQSQTEVTDHLSYFQPSRSRYDSASEREFWEIAAAAASSSKSFLQKLRPKDVALAIVALVLALGVVSAWPSSNGRLTWFGSMVVRIGLARHAVPAYAGNPGVNVWVDEQTAQYYCPGEERYENAAPGHLTTQLEAEQAQLQPASGLVCQ